MKKTDLSKFDNRWYKPGRGPLVRFCWYMVNAVFFNSNALLPYAWKSSMLRFFGAEVGKGVVIKPHVNIKYPWRLQIGAYSWIGEGVWIDNLAEVSLGSHVCVSQGALILSGNHDYSKEAFDLMLKPIHIEDGAWVGAKCVVTQGITIGSHAIVVVGSVASTDLEPYTINRGNPAVKVKDRSIEG